MAPERSTSVASFSRNGRKRSSVNTRRLFLRGLLHADGCRVLNRVNGKSYPRYFFTQVSQDIRDIFCRTCDQLGIVTTSRSRKTVSVARASSVALLDSFVGAKA